MLILMFILLLACIISAKFSKPDEFHKDYLSKESTNAVNGVFVALVFLRHFSQYVKFSSEPIDSLFVTFNGYLGQLLVTTFLFYSGYGIVCSIKAKGDSYVNSIPKKRILSVWLHFFIAVLLFCITNIVLGKKYALDKVLLSFIGWSSIGNSNWYIFAVLFLYLFVFISFKIFKNKYYLGVAATTVLIVLWTAVMIKMGRPNYTYNVLICYPMGMLYALLKPQIEKIVMKNDLIYSLTLMANFLILVCLYKYRNTGVEGHSLWSAAFVMLVVLLSMKIKLGNGFLSFLGSHVFGIYILQRIPMMILANMGYNKDIYSFLIMSFLITVPMTLIFDTLMSKLDKKLKLS